MMAANSAARQARLDRILCAAITVVATQGARSLTHRRVDSQAGLPQGTTSHYFRTASALVEGTIQAISAREVPLMAPFMAIASLDDAVAAFVGLGRQMLGPQRELAIARHRIFFETSGTNVDPNQAPTGDNALLDFAVPVFQALGAPRPRQAARLALAAFDGAILHGLLTPIDLDEVDDIIESAIRAGFPSA